MEIERKFRVADVAGLPDLSELPARELRQGYLVACADGEVRLRQDSGRFVLTVKSGSGVKREESEIYLTAEQFSALWPVTQGRRIEKRRHLFQERGATVEIDVFLNDLEGLVLAEVEFGSLADAEAYRPPPWLGAEVTGVPEFTNAHLAVHGLPDAKGDRS
jgi:CYTH domain-containing protein